MTTEKLLHKPLEKIVKFSKAWDKRDPDPAKNYGIHGMEMRFLLKGPRGVVQFVVFTNWMTKKVQKEQDGKYHDHLLCHPMPADLGYHSYVPHYPDQTPIGPCEYLEGQNCYYDGSGLRAEPVYWTLVEEGEEAMWKILEEEYERIFEEGDKNKELLEQVETEAEGEK